MRVLWFTGNLLPAMLRQAGKDDKAAEPWVAQLAGHISGQNGIELGIATAFAGFPEMCFKEQGISYFVVPQPRRFSASGMRWKDLRKCAAIIERFQPDIIHIHGSERFFGMTRAAGLTHVPTLVSVQGLLGPFSMARHFFGTLSPMEIIKSIRLIELPIRYGIAWHYFDMKMAARREARILRAVDGFLGRTEWDRAHCRATRPDMTYYDVGEILRPVFYEKRWSLEHCDRHTIIYTNAGQPRRGTENLLACVALLRKEFPDIRLRLGGRISTRSGYGRFIRRRIKTLGLEDRIDFLGYIDDATMVRELVRTHVFAITSYIENSPNSLGEAMLVGMPCVASFVGGIPSMVRDGETGMLYPVEDVPMLAEKIRSLFLDDDLAVRLGANAHNIARRRHDPDVVVAELMTAYHMILATRSTRPQ